MKKYKIVKKKKPSEIFTEQTGNVIFYFVGTLENNFEPSRSNQLPKTQYNLDYLDQNYEILNEKYSLDIFYGNSSGYYPLFQMLKL